MNVICYAMLCYNISFSLTYSFILYVVCCMCCVVLFCIVWLSVLSLVFHVLSQFSSYFRAPGVSV